MSAPKLSRATKFIIASVLDQGKREGVPLTDVEIQMLGFAEATASEKDMEAAETFERDYDEQEFEMKIAKLLVRAFNRDKANGESAVWDYALADLEEEDLYLKVMLDLAGIGGSASLEEFIDRKFILAIAPAVILLTAGIVVGLRQSVQDSSQTTRSGCACFSFSHYSPF